MAILIVILLLLLSILTFLGSFTRIRDIKYPTAPNNLNATVIDNRTIELKWNVSSSSGSSSVIKYSIYRSLTPGNETFYQISENLTSLIYHDTNIIIGQTYYYKISASNKWGEGPLSNEANATITIIKVEYPTAPKNLNATAIDDKTIELKWNAPSSSGSSSVIKYSIYRSITSEHESFYRNNENLTSLIYNDTNVTIGQTYYYRISASNKWGEGSLSNEANATIWCSSTNSTRSKTWIPGWGQRTWDSALDSTGLYVVGTFFNAGSSTSSGLTNAFLLKYNLNGKLFWNRTWGPYEIMLEGIALDSSSIYLSGTTNISYNHGLVLLIKLDLNGNTIWNRSWGDVTPNGSKIGITLHNKIIYITGNYFNNNNNVAICKLFLVAYDIEGNYLWNRTWNYAYGSETVGIKINASNIYIIGNTLVTKDGLYGIFLAKFDLSGNMIWSRFWNTNSWNYSEIVIFPNDFVVNSDAIYMVGYYGASPKVYGFMNVFDTNGNLIWNRTWNNYKQNIFDGIAIDTSAIYVTETTYENNYHQIILLKFNLAGNLTWNQTIDQHGTGAGSNIKIDSKCIYIDSVTTDIVSENILFVKINRIQ